MRCQIYLVRSDMEGTTQWSSRNDAHKRVESYILDFTIGFQIEE